MKRWMIRTYLKLSGWKLTGENPPFKKYIFIVAPHTSQTDFVYGKLFCMQAGLKPRFLIKQEAFWFPLGLLLRSLGGVPVNRSSASALASQMVREFDRADDFILVITPEGTRKRVTRWKKGFHFIARQARVPVALAFIDYKTRTMGIGPHLFMTDDFESDIKKIKTFYRDMEGRHSGRFSVGDDL